MSATAPQEKTEAAAPRRQLTLLDTTSIIVGIVIGSSIYLSASDIANTMPNLGWLLGVWLLGGVLSFIGALCYAELANAYPNEGGDYVYLTRAFGRRLGFLFGWAQFWVVRPGSVGAMAYIFAQYANELVPLGKGPWPLIVYAVGSIVMLTGVNLLGIREGKWTQNVLAIVKYVGLILVVGAGFWFGGTSVPQAATAVADSHSFNLSFAMILIFYAFGGWNEMAYVGAEVRDPPKNILRALLLGTVAVTVLYLLLNLAFVYALGLDGVRKSHVVAADVLRIGLGETGSRLISALICISALGSINGMVFTGARIYYAMGTEHRLFAWLGQWNAGRGTPIRAMVIQAVVTIALTIGFGLTKAGFLSSVKFTTPVFWLFFLLVGLSLFVLRYREPHQPRPYRVPLYPVIPILFCLSSLFMVYSSLDYALKNQTYEALWSVGLIILGVVLSVVEPKSNRR